MKERREKRRERKKERRGEGKREREREREREFSALWPKILVPIPKYSHIKLRKIHIQEQSTVSNHALDVDESGQKLMLS